VQVRWTVRERPRRSTNHPQSNAPAKLTPERLWKKRPLDPLIHCIVILRAIDVCLLQYTRASLIALQMLCVLWNDLFSNTSSMTEHNACIEA
jgi:hypothetical protein